MTAGAKVVTVYAIPRREEARVATEPTVLAAWTATVVRALTAKGVDGIALARGAGVAPEVLDLPDGRVPLSQSSALWRAAVEATGDPCFGLEVSRFVRPTTFKSLSLGVVSSETLGDALDRCVRFGGLILSSTGINTCLERNGRYEYTWRSTSAAGERPTHESMEAILGSIVRAGRFLLDRSTSPCEVFLQRPERPPASRFEAFFRCPVRYGRDHYLLAYDLDVVRQIVPSGSPDLARTADRLTSDYLDRVHPTERLTDQVRSTIEAMLCDGEPTSVQVASALAMSSRTMQRRLHEEGTTFRDLVADVRIARAKHLIATQHLAPHQLAHRLGFSDPAAFRRAFKRHTGMTAGQFAAHVSRRAGRAVARAGDA